MKAKVLTAVLILSGLLVASDKGYASCGPEPPVAILVAEPEYVILGGSVTLDGSDSYDPDGNIVKYEWDFTNDDSNDYYETSSYHPDGAFDGITTHTYSDPCVYTAKLIVKDNGSYLGTNTCTVYVSEDSDSDGLPDAWEDEYGLDPNDFSDADTDLDEDGYNNLSEYLHGSVPDVNSSVPVDNITIAVPGYVNSIQRAINASIDSDTIVVSNGTYYEVVDFNGISCTLTSTDPNDWDVVADTIIDANDPNACVVTFENSEDANSVLRGFTITGGELGIYCDGASPTIGNCVIIENGSEDNNGGGMLVGNYCSPSVMNCFFHENYANFGGGMYNVISSPIVVNCVFSENDANCGGGVYNSSAFPTVINCTFSGNFSVDDGGGMYNLGAPSCPKVTNCIFWGNDANDSGDEIYNTASADPNFSYCDIEGCGGSGNWVPNFGTDGGGNIDEDPLFTWIPPDGIVSYWKFDEDEGDTAYDSVGNNHGTVYGAQWTTGQIDGALSFDGDDDYVLIPEDPSLDFSRSFSISAWVCPHIKNQHIFTHYHSSSTGKAIHIKIYNTGLLKFGFYYDDLNTASGAIPFDSWSFVVCTYDYDSDTSAIYVNSVLNTSGPNGPYTGSNVASWIGKSWTSEQNFDGTIDDVRIYDKALSTSEIQQLYLNGWSCYHLSHDSPCINRGDPNGSYAGQMDIDGDPRLMGARVDMGADEVVVWYVDADANGSDDGSSWDDAFDDLQEALDVATAGDGIWVAEGTYKPTGGNDRSISFELVEGAGVYGGFDGNETAREDRDWTVHETILSGDINEVDDPNDNSYHVVVGADSAILDGFIITGGNANGSDANENGGGIYCDQSSFTIRRCVISDNTAQADGGGIYCEDSNPILTNCVIVENEAGDNGGGIYDYNSSPRLINCTFSGNYADSNGGGMYNYGACSEPNVTNCIFWGNDANDYGDEIYNAASADPNFSYCDINGCGGSGGTWDPNFGSDDGGNIDSDPCFVDANNPAGSDGIFLTLDDGLRLAIDSPCIDAADGDAAPSTDILGHGRVDIYDVNNTGVGSPNYVDIGTYEFGCDSDGDGMPDDWEILYGLDPHANDAVLDGDEDELTNLEEYHAGTYPNDADSDDDSMPDGWESTYGLDPVNPNDDNTDLDGDSYINLSEYLHGSDPNNDANVPSSNVTICVPVDVSSIKLAIKASIDGDVIEVLKGTYYENIDFKGKAITVESTDPNDWEVITGTIIDANNSNANVVEFETSEDANSVLRGFTITGGGRGIYCSGASPTISNCMIAGNNCDDSGGGMQCTNSASPTITNCIFSDNSTDADDCGAGMNNQQNSSPTVTNCIFIGNDSAGEGGGMRNHGSSPTVINCTFSGNDGEGGGMYNENSSPTVTNCVFSGNFAAINGGGMVNLNYSSPTVTSCTFSGNSADYGEGGGMYNANSSPTVTNCIFWDSDDDEIYNSSADPNFSYCDIKGCGGSGGWDPNFGTDGGGNIDSDPQFVDPNCPAGPDDIFMTVYDGLRLSLNSPCTDAADGDAAPSTDILGLGRLDSYVNNTGTGDPNYTDMGAYENQGGVYLLFGMDVNSVTGDSNEVVITTAGATYVLSTTGMEMRRRIDPNTNAIDPNLRQVAELIFDADIGPLSIQSSDAHIATIQSDKATFDFFSDSLFFVTAKDSFTYDHNNLIADAPWNAPLDPNKRYLDRMWTDGYGGSLHANILGNAVAETNDVNFTTISMSQGDVTAHMVFPPKFFDFNGLYGQDANGQDVRPFVHFIYFKSVMDDIMDPNTDPNMDTLKNDSFGVFTLFHFPYTGGYKPVLLESGIMGYDANTPFEEDVRDFIDLAHEKGFKVISYLAGPRGWDYPDDPNHPKAGQHQHTSVTLDWMREFQEEYDFDGWYFDGGHAGDFLDDYNFMRQARTDVGKDGIIFHHDSVDVWDPYNVDYSITGLKAVMIGAYVNYNLSGEGGKIAIVDYPNDKYFRYFSAGYGMSQAYSAHKRRNFGKAAMSEEEKRRVMGENLNGCERKRNSSWLSHFKPVYDIRKDEYLDHIEDPNIPFDPDVDWPIDPDPCTGGWFRSPADINVTDINSTSVEITWTTPEVADSDVAYTSNESWWSPFGPDGIVYDGNMVTDHTITLSGLDPNTYEFRIRSTNDANDPPSVPGQIIWGYVGSFTIN